MVDWLFRLKDKLIITKSRFGNTSKIFNFEKTDAFNEVISRIIINRKN